MQNIFQFFASQRMEEIKFGEIMPDPDPYLALAGLVHETLHPKTADRAAMVYQGSARFLTETEIQIIKDGGPLKLILNRSENETD